MLQKLNELMEEFNQHYSQAETKADVLNLKSEFIGKKGKLNSILKSLKNAGPEEKKEIGAKSNVFKIDIQAQIDSKLAAIEMEEINRRLAADWRDITLKESNMDLGLKDAGYHPVTIVQREIEDIFLSMGFDILDGPHIEDDYHNFEALNTPENHPARDMQDTFWFPDLKHLLRTHTSSIQVRGMKEKKPPFKFVAPGKVFRCENTDASHEVAFHQLEGMMVGKDISVANLIYFMKVLLSEIFRKPIDVRLRPGFFPFVEPGFELDIKCLICGGDGCSVCKHQGWVELLPCGLVHPTVLRHGDIDPDEFTGFAFGLGLDRLVMMRYGIDDIRLIHGGDLRFSAQFNLY
ncbi:MAG: phenylalanine--tRNA ligase subunit alpha [bacterium]|nr:phenylalanine--tRNA ligase subunit alpha [bacterium]